MGKRLKSQRRGKGSPMYIASKKGRKTSYISLEKTQKEDVLNGQVIDIIKDPGKTNVLAEILFENNLMETVVAAEGLMVGQKIQYGKKADIAIGNVLPLKEIPEGCPIFNLERTAGDGGQLVKSSGSYALVVSKDKKKAFVKLPSGNSITIDSNARATIGCSAGGGRKEKPFIKAGNKFYFMKAKGRPYPTVRGVAMNAVDHPFGGEQHHPGKSKSTSRHAPPGRKVGAIASKRTGRKKK